jgi:nucleotide-binding universal stress UspA family protein
MYTRILVATDGSRSAARALEEACTLARGAGARVRVVHVVDSPYAYPDAWYPAGTVDVEAVDRSWRRAGQAILEQAARQAQETGVAVETALLQREGQRVSRVIVDEATRWSAEVIVVGVHGQGQGPEQLLIGSVTDGVVRLAGLPVLLVRAR